MATLINNAPKELGYMRLTSLLEKIANENQVSRNMEKPFRFSEVEAKLGTDPALLVMTLLKRQNTSLQCVDMIIHMLQTLADGMPITIAELDFLGPTCKQVNFTLRTDGFLSFDLSMSKNLSCFFQFSPESRCLKSQLRDGEKGYFELDIEIELYLKVTIPSIMGQAERAESIKIATVIVEFDGEHHLKDQMVRKDKDRDSMIQSKGATVFRIQTPYKDDNVRKSQHEEEIRAITKKQTEDVKEYFRNTLFNYLQAAKLINLSEFGSGRTKTVPLDLYAYKKR